jgi:hypothetical protein
VSVPREMTALCNDAMARDVSARISSAQEFRNRLSRCVAHMHSVQMARDATESLGALRALVHANEPDPVAVARVGSECRFGFRQALREWQGNPEAHAGLQACLELLFAHEVSRKNLDAARAAAAEMPARTAAHDDALAALEHERTKATQETERLREEGKRLHALERDLDERVSARQRLVGLGTVSLLLIGIAANSVRRSLAGDPVSTHESMVTAVVLVSVVVSLAVLLRRSLLNNTANRRFTVWALAFTMLLLAHRAVATRFGHSPEATFATELVTVDLQFALAGALVTQMLYIPCVVLVPFVLASWVWPMASGPLFAVGNAIALSTLSVVMFVRERKSARK